MQTFYLDSVHNTCNGLVACSFRHYLTTALAQLALPTAKPGQLNRGSFDCFTRHMNSSPSSPTVCSVCAPHYSLQADGSCAPSEFASFVRLITLVLPLWFGSQIALVELGSHLALTKRVAAPAVCSANCRSCNTPGTCATCNGNYTLTAGACAPGKCCCLNSL